MLTWYEFPSSSSAGSIFLFLGNTLQQFRCRFFVRVLRHELAAHREIERKAA
jgi:hypothetical protein